MHDRGLEVIIKNTKLKDFNATGKLCQVRPLAHGGYRKKVHLPVLLRITGNVIKLLSCLK